MITGLLSELHSFSGLFEFEYYALIVYYNMVRVISVHHFESQTIQTCEEALAVTAAPPDRVLIALPHHVIEVRDLSSSSKRTFSFPTVDRVSYLSYCSTGNYVATVESKVSRQDQEVVYSRVYTNWETSKGEDQPMRARIAGRVTPSSSQTGGDVLEMIELPSKFAKITAITPCEETGNIMIACDRILCLFQLVTRTHDISRQRFLDFELWPVTLELSFSPSWLRMSEDVVAAMNSTSLHVFRLNKGFARASDWSSHSQKTPERRKGQEKSKNEELDCPIDLETLLKEVASGGNKEQAKLGNGQLPVLAMLPSLRSGRAHDPSRNLRASPFKPPGSVTMGVAIKEIPANEPWAEQMTTMVESLLQLELGEWAEEDSPEKFTCLALRPLYRINRNASGKAESSCPRLRSPVYTSLVAFNCLVCTQQEGFMYHFPVEDGEVMSLGKCISEYNFTSVVKHVVLEPSLLHAVTTTGLETYTLRTLHAIYENNEMETCPPVDEPVCLLGLRPFLGVVGLLLTKSYVVILSSSVESNSKRSSSVGDLTIYSLKLPSVESLYKEMLYIASGHRLGCPTAYMQLLTEAHTLIRSTINITPSHQQQPVLGQHLHLYRESCAFLSDYYLTCETEEEWEKGYKYSLMAGLSPTMVMDRLKKIEADAKEAGITVSTKEGLGHYLKECLIRCDEDSSLPSGALNRLLELAQAPQGDSKTCLVSTLVLQSPLLRQFSTETSIRIIKKHIKESGGELDTQDGLALCVLYIARGKINDAGHVLDLIQDDNSELIDLLLEYWTLLFDSTKQVFKRNTCGKVDWDGVTLSELAVLFIEKRPKDLALILSSLIVDQCTLQLADILQVFLTYLPARMGSGGCAVTHVLQIFLERVFNGWNDIDPNWRPDPCDIPTLDALKILMRSYLSDMLVKSDHKKLVSDKEENEEVDVEKMFGGKRPQFLELLPPFCYSDADRSQFTSLLKLQCLLCSGWLEENVLSELVQFVSEFIPEEIGFNLLVLSQPMKAVEMLVNKYPTVLPQYNKDMLCSEPEWKHLIAILQLKVDEEVEGDKDNETKLYSQILEEVLNDLARSLSCEVFTRIVPAGKEFEGYILTCQQTAHASHLRDVIKVTGDKLMATLNIKSFT